MKSSSDYMHSASSETGLIDFSFSVYTIVLSLALAAFINKSIYNLYFHPLSKYPGPWYARASRLPFVYYQVIGRLPHEVRKMHERYGETVRIAPNDLSYLQSQAWFDIHGHKTATRPGWFERDPSVYPPLPGRAPSILLSNESDHGRFRRCLSHAFSEKALRDQEPLIQSHVHLLISKLHEQIDGPEKGIVNISNWLNFVTFDIIGDLALGESFGCLEAGVIHPWVSIMFSALRDIVYLAALAHLPKFIFDSLMWFIIPMLGDLKKDREFSAAKVGARLKQGSNRNDFMSPILKAGVNDAKGMSVPEIQSSFNILIVAGSETTATLLSGALYHLALYPRVRKTLLAELHAAFPSKLSTHVTMAQVQNLSYLNAVLEESLRVYPPSAFNQARIVPPEGAVVCGEMLPPGTSVAVATYAAFLSDRNWTDPEIFKPERWLGEEAKGDDRRVMQPFIVGPRNCLGKNLAYAEMRLILTQLLLEFDFELCDESLEWKDAQRFFLLWERPPLSFRLKRANNVIG